MPFYFLLGFTSITEIDKFRTGVTRFGTLCKGHFKGASLSIKIIVWLFEKGQKAPVWFTFY